MGALKSALPMKFKSRKEQIIHYAAATGEISTDLYTVLGITPTNYRMQLSKLRQENIIRTIKLDGLTGYALTNIQKRKLKKEQRYQEILQSTNTDVRKRKRMQNFGFVFATLDKQNIEYEPYRKPTLSNGIAEELEKVFSYTANEFKKAQKNGGITINGSKSYGILISKREVIPVYKAVYELPEFFVTEFQYIQLLKRYFQNCEIRKAVLMCNNLYAVKKISEAIINFKPTNKGRNITDSGYYSELIILPIIEHNKLLMWTLYNENTLVSSVKKQKKITNKKSAMVNDGFIENEPLIFMFNFDIAKLNMFIGYNSISNNNAIIVTYDFYVPIIKKLIDNNRIRIIAVNTEEIEKRCELQ